MPFPSFEAFVWSKADIVLHRDPDVHVLGRFNIDGHRAMAFDEQGYLVGQMTVAAMQGTGPLSYELIGDDGERWDVTRGKGCNCGGR